MVNASYSNTWKSSTQVRKQRKYRFNAPLHVKQKMMAAHLSKDLRAKHNTRSAGLCKGDKVRVLRGKYAKQEATVERVLLKRDRVYLTGIERFKKAGPKVAVAFAPSNLMIIELNLKDAKRKAKLGGVSSTKVAPAPAKKEAATQKSQSTTTKVESKNE